MQKSAANWYFAAGTNRQGTDRNWNVTAVSHKCSTTPKSAQALTNSLLVPSLPPQQELAMAEGFFQHVLLGYWAVARANSHARHAARRLGNLHAAAEFSRKKIDAILRAMSIDSTCFRVQVEYVHQAPHYNVACTLTGQCLHIPSWVHLPPEVTVIPAKA